MLTMKRRFAVVILVVVGICLFFMVTVVNQRYSGIEAVTMLQEKESSDSQSMQQKESLAVSSSQQKESSNVASLNSAAESIAEVPEDMNQNVSKLSKIKDRKDILDFIHKQCKKYGKLTVKPGEAKRPRKMVIPKNWKEHKLIYASNPKTGSSSFKKWVSKMQGNKNPYSQIKHVHLMWKYGNVQQIFEDATQRLGHEATLVEAVEPMFKVTVVRNPITKLLSGYKDKVKRLTKYGMKPVMQKINPNLRPNSTDAEKYAAFVEAVVTRKLRNHHYTPQWNKMKICDFPYDMILQTETTNQQIHVVQEHTNNTQYEFPSSKTGASTLQQTEEYYSLIGPELMEQLHRYYLWDFVLMGYSKLDNPNFPYLDFDQDIDKEFGNLISNYVDITTEEPGTQPTEDPTQK